MLTVFGSINIDQVIRVTSIPQPGETKIGERIMDSHGGKGANQAIAAARASDGKTPITMIGALGNDLNGENALQNLLKNGVISECVQYSDCETGMAIITVSQDGENAITVIPGANAKLKFKHISKETLKRTSILMCQGEVNLLETYMVIAAFRKTSPSGVVVVNLAPVPQDGDLMTLRNVLEKCDILIVNEHEAKTISQLLSDQNMVDLQSIATQFNLKILKTRGADGVDLLSQAGLIFQAPSPTVDPIDTTGAGDTFCGVFAILLAEGQSIEFAINKACEAAAKACCAIGAQTSMPFRDEFLKRVEAK